MGPDTVSPASPDLGALAQPGTAAMSAPAMPTASPEVMMPAVAPSTVTMGETGVNPAVPPTPPKGGTPVGTPNPPSPHQRLMSMIQGLALGVSALATSAATQGREGGPEEVVRVRGEQQRQQIASQQAATAQRNAQIQQQQMVLDTTAKQINTALLFHTFNNEISKSDLEVQAKKLGVVGATQEIRTKALEDLKQTGDMNTYLETMRKTGAPAPAATTPTAAGTPDVLPGVSLSAGAKTQDSPAGSVPPIALSYWQNSIDEAMRAYPDDPVIQKQAAVLADPKATPQAMATAATMATNRLNAFKAGALARKTEAEAKTAETAAAYAVPKTQAEIAKSHAEAASSAASQAKSAFELGQEKREQSNLAVADATGFTSPLTVKEYDKRYDAYTKSKDYQTLSTLRGSYQQFQDTMQHIASTGEMTGAESVVGLFNAIGISATPLAGKGFRINSNVISEHAEARGIDQAAYQRLLALKSGDIITPQQLLDYSNIAAGVYHNAYVNAADEAHRQGIPADFLPQGGGRAADSITRRIFTDVMAHTHPELTKDPKALAAAARNAASINGWK